MNLLASIGTVMRFGVRWLLRIYYPVIAVRGQEHIPASGPVLLVANHPNSLLDAALIAWVARRPVHFFAKAPLFDVPVFGSLLRAFGMVPAYRGSDDKSQVKRNLESLAAGAAWLKKGAAVGIFPEGKSHDSFHVEAVLSGAARMALQGTGEGQPVPILPVGLNYERKEQFRSSVWVNVGERIEVTALPPNRPLGDEKRAIREVTGEIDRRLKKTVIHLEQPGWEPLLSFLETLRPAARHDAVAGLLQRKRIADAVNHFLTVDRSRTEAMATTIRRHQENLATFGLEMGSEIVDAHSSHRSWRDRGRSIVFVAGLIPALAGILLYYVPFVVTRAIARRLQQPGRTTMALSRFSVGLIIYGLWYLMVWLTLIGWLGYLWGSLWILALPLLKLLAWQYRLLLPRKYRQWREAAFMSKRREDLDRLRAERAGIRSQLAIFAEEFTKVAGPPAAY
jgi:glycerol-3-phosphate O-acyltransferase/dihydroxyacetone phosphate acyltransferase